MVAEVRWHPVRLLRPTLWLLGLLTLLGWVAGGLPERSILGPWLPVPFTGLLSPRLGSCRCARSPT